MLQYSVNDFMMCIYFESQSVTFGPNDLVLSKICLRHKNALFIYIDQFYVANFVLHAVNNWYQKKGGFVRISVRFFF